MATVKNSIDKILQAAATRTVNMPGTTAADWAGAAAAAAAAQSAADAANATLLITTSDNQLSKGEKPAEILRWNAIVGEVSGIQAQADSLVVSRSAFDSAYTTLNGYLSGMTGAPAWTDVNVDTPIVGTTYRTNFLNYYNAKAALLKAIADKIQANAGAAQTTANAAKAASDAIFADGVLDRSEKSDLVRRVGEKDGEYTGLVNQAAALSVSSTAYAAANTAVNVYLTGLSPAWNDTTQNTNIVRADANTAWNNYYNAKVDLQNAIAAKAATLSSWGGTSNRPANLAALGGTEAIQNSLISLGTLGMTTFRVVAQGGASSAAPITPGLYINGAFTLGVTRSFYVAIIRRSDGVIVQSVDFDVYGGGALTGGRDAGTMAGMLNSYGPSYIAVVWSNDEPQTNRLTGGLATAMYRCGASRAVFGSPAFQYRSAYILVGICGIGEGNGAEAYQGGVSNDPNAWCDMGFNIVGGNMVGVSTSFKPNTLADFSYTGALDATKGATWGVDIGGANKPADNATVGAPSGTNVGSTPATTVESNAASGAAASTAMANRPTVTLNTGSLSNQRATNTSASVSRGTVSANVSGGNGSISYQWTVVVSDSDSTSVAPTANAASPTSSSTVINAKFASDSYITIYIQLTVTDSKGLTASASYAFVTHQGAYL